MTNKFQLIKISNSKIFQSDFFEFEFMSFVAYLFFGFCDLVIGCPNYFREVIIGTNRILELNWKF